MSSAAKYLFEAALEIQCFFNDNHWDFTLIGGLAVLRWGKPRTTYDVDGTLLTLFDHEDHYIDTLLARFKSRIADAKDFALTYRVLLLTASNDMAVDISLGGMPFEQQMVERSSVFEYDKGYELRTCSAEDLIVLKAFAARDKDWADVDSILRRQKGKLDTDYICENLKQLCEWKESPDIMAKFHQMLITTDQQR